MTLFREIEPDQFVAWRGEPLPTPLWRWSEPEEVEENGEVLQVRRQETYVSDVDHPLAIEQLWSDDELAILKLYRAGPADDVPAHHRILSSAVRRVDGVVRWVYELEEITVDARKATMLAALADRRWQAETGGLSFESMRIPTDRETQARIDQIVKAYADGDISGPIKFKMSFGFVDLTESHLRAIKRAGAVHIQDCFAKEAYVSGLIVAAQSHADLDAVDFDHGWPSEE